MNKRQMVKWVKALRSGKFKQGRSYLRAETRDEDGYICDVKHCCLGVLGEVNGVDFDKTCESEVLNKSHKKLGLKDEEGKVVVRRKDMFGDYDYKEMPIKIARREFNSLAEANDRGISFRRIATWIEKNYRKL